MARKHTLFWWRLYGGILTVLLYRAVWYERTEGKSDWVMKLEPTWAWGGAFLVSLLVWPISCALFYQIIRFAIRQGECGLREKTEHEPRLLPVLAFFHASVANGLMVVLNMGFSLGLNLLSRAF